MQRAFYFSMGDHFMLFVVALVMELAPWPAGFQAFKPSWLILVLLYWTLALPDRVSIGLAFLLGFMGYCARLYFRRACAGTFYYLLFCF